MTPLRKKLFLVLSALGLLITIIVSWDLLPGSAGKIDRQNSQANVTDNLELRSFEIQSKLFVGAIEYFETRSSEEENSQFKSLAGPLKENFKNQVLIPEEKDSVRLMQHKLALSLYFKDNDNAAKLYSAIKRKQIVATESENETTNELNDTIASAYSCIAETKTKKQCDISENDKSFLTEQLGWVGEIYLLLLSEGTPEYSQLKEAVNTDTQKVFQKFSIIFTFGSAFVMICLISFVVISYKLFTGKLHFKFQPSEMNPDFCLEIFCLYIYGMLLGNVALFKLSGYFPKLDPLIGNLVIICSMPLLIFWPRLFSVNLRSIIRSIGMRIDGVVSFLKDVAIAPLTYAGSWVALFLILIIYAGVLVKLGVDVSQGTHPIVPILLESGGQRTFLLIIFLAVVVAPIVEEIMFRGALYSWLRSHCGITLSIIFSAVIFASIHPQGAVGVVPLTCIGFVLAFLREWRNSLIAPMVAHACFNGGTMLLIWLLYL